MPAVRWGDQTMSQLASSSQALGTAIDRPQHVEDERLPIPQAALLVVSASLGLWTCIGLAVRWAFF